jgi:molybdenum ABC transporter molybdate-binding protein
MSKAKWAKDWTVGLRAWIEHRGQAVLGQGRADLLEAISRHRSITAAAKAAGMSYRRAWTMIQEINQAAGEPLVEAAVGGIKGGGAQLTERGRFAVEVYRQLHTALHDSAAGVLRRIISPSEDALPCVHLAAAISLQEVMGQLLAEYALRRPAVRVRAVYGASNELADHLLGGAPGDLFIAAEASVLNRLDAADITAARSRRTVALNGLAVIGPPGDRAVRKLADLLTHKVQHIALAEPACPLGNYSQAYLQSAGVYDALLPKIVHVDNSRGVLSAVASGAADTGLAFTSDALRTDQCQTFFQIPQSQAAAEYVAVIVKSGQQQAEARLLLDYITSPQAAKCFSRCGFRPAKLAPKRRLAGGK